GPSRRLREAGDAGDPGDAGHAGEPGGAAASPRGSDAGAGEAGAAPAAAIDPASAAPTMVLRQTVRSGQVVYARRGDLIVCAPINPGAQVIADGHIHVYGPLRGVALAGAAGNADARIFCQCLAAEIVSVAGEYLSADEIPED